MSNEMPLLESIEAAEKALLSRLSAQGPLDVPGATYEPAYDRARLTGLALRVFELMSDGHWRTLGEIQSITGNSEGGVHARLRCFRRKEFGSHKVNRRRRGDPKSGIHEYQLEVNDHA